MICARKGMWDRVRGMRGARSRGGGYGRCWGQGEGGGRVARDGTMGE